MSYEIISVKHKCPCPCGKGEIVYGLGMDDWNRTQDGLTEIWCSACAEKYRIDNDGLIEKSYPTYHGDEDLNKQMHQLWDKIHNYDMYIPKDLQKKRWIECCTQDELKILQNQPNSKEDKCLQKYVQTIIESYARNLSDLYTLKELTVAKREMCALKYSTRLKGNALDMAQKHKLFFKTIKLKEVLYPIDVAIRNYDKYKKYNKEDEKSKEEKKENSQQRENNRNKANGHFDMSV